MAVAVSCAVGLLVVNPSWLQQSWMHAKLLFVAFLLGYHWLCYRLMGQLQRVNATGVAGNCGRSMSCPPCFW